MDKHRFDFEFEKGLSGFNVLGDMPLMEQEEVDCIKSYLKPEHIMFEWGSGGSTLYFPKYVKKFYTVEHQMHWHRHIRNHLRKDKELREKVKMYYIPSDEYYSYEDKNWKRSWFETYISLIGNVGESVFDIILVDGENRTRGFCAEEATKYMNNQSIVFIHDYYDRPEIHWVEKYFDIVEKIETGATLVVMKKK